MTRSWPVQTPKCGGGVTKFLIMNGMLPIMSCHFFSFMFFLFVVYMGCDSQLLIKKVAVSEVERLQGNEAVTPVPILIRRSFNLDPFYKKYLSANGLPIVS